MRNKDIIKQYVNTGKSIPEYQFNKLTLSLQKSYMRKRTIVEDTTEYYIGYQAYEIKMMSNTEIDKLLSKSVDKDITIKDALINVIPKDMLKKYFLMFYDRYRDMPEEYFNYLDKDLKRKMIERYQILSFRLSQYMFMYVSDDAKYKEIYRLIDVKECVPDYCFDFVDNYDLKMKIIRHNSNVGILTKNMLEWLRDNNKVYLDEFIGKFTSYIPYVYMPYLSDERFMEYLEENCAYRSMCKDFFDYITNEQAILYIKFCLKHNMKRYVTGYAKLSKIAKENNLI